MSRTDKTRPYLIAYLDPYNRRFRMIGVPDGSGREWLWKKITSCSSSRCCFKPWLRKENKKKRLQARRELRKLYMD